MSGETVLGFCSLPTVTTERNAMREDRRTFSKAVRLMINSRLQEQYRAWAALPIPERLRAIVEQRSDRGGTVENDRRSRNEGDR
jgi:hypothetical protein